MSDRGWIGVDLDGTLALYDGWKGPDHIGAPIPDMLERVKAWIAEGRDVRIFTARVYQAPDTSRPTHVYRAIEAWCAAHIGKVLPITNEKDYGMIRLFDDRAVQVETNTGRLILDGGANGR